MHFIAELWNKPGSFLHTLNAKWVCSILYPQYRSNAPHGLVPWEYLMYRITIYHIPYYLLTQCWSEPANIRIKKRWRNKVHKLSDWTQPISTSSRYCPLISLFGTANLTLWATFRICAGTLGPFGSALDSQTSQLLQEPALASFSREPAIVRQ